MHPLELLRYFLTCLKWKGNLQENSVRLRPDWERPSLHLAAVFQGLHFLVFVECDCGGSRGEENLLRRLMFLTCNNLLCQKKILPHSLPFCLYNCHKQCTPCTSATPLFTWSTGQTDFERRHRTRQLRVMCLFFSVPGQVGGELWPGPGTGSQHPVSWDAACPRL